MTATKPRSGKLHLLLIAAVFVGPLLVAAWMYFGAGLVPEGRSNHGALLEPIMNLEEELPSSPLHGIGGDGWLLVHMNTAGCDEACRDALYTLRQARLMLGKEMDRLTRVLLHGDTPPDKVFLAAEHAGLESLQDVRLAGLLGSRTPADLCAGGYFLVDPLGNLVMYFGPELDPSEMVDDIKHLLKLSRIG